MKYRNDIDYFSVNGEILSIASFPFDLAAQSGLVYEVFRINNSVPLFLNEHLQRLKYSIIINSAVQIDVSNIKTYIRNIISVNSIIEGNLKLVISVENNITSAYLYFIPHRYPSSTQLENGVALILQKSMRKNPTAKISDWKIRGKANSIIDNNKIYETALVNDNGEITEGSRSNIFFIKNDILYTALDEYVLSGITRGKVIEAAQKMEIKIIYRNVKYTELNKYDACFISGSSPGVLQVKSIDNNYFSINNSVYLNIRKLYEKMSEH